LLRKNDLECACLAGYTDFTLGMKNSMIPTREIQIIYVTYLAELARDLNCKMIRIFTGNELDSIPYSKQWDLCVEGIKECCRQASRYGIIIGIQNHHDIAVDARSLSYLVNEINEPNCKIMFDAWAPTLQGMDLKESVDYISKYLVYTTVADYIRVPRYKYQPDLVNYTREADRTLAVPMGEGIIDYREFFKILKEPFRKFR